MSWGFLERAKQVVGQYAESLLAVGGAGLAISAMAEPSSDLISRDTDLAKVAVKTAYAMFMLRKLAEGLRRDSMWASDIRVSSAFLFSASAASDLVAATGAQGPIASIIGDSRVSLVAAIPAVVLRLVDAYMGMELRKPLIGVAGAAGTMLAISGVALSGINPEKPLGSLLAAAGIDFNLAATSLLYAGRPEGDRAALIAAAALFTAFVVMSLAAAGVGAESLKLTAGAFFAVCIGCAFDGVAAQKARKANEISVAFGSRLAAGVDGGAVVTGAVPHSASIVSEGSAEDTAVHLLTTRYQ